MTMRRFKLNENTSVEPCPHCGNNRDFVAHSDYCAEDCCEVWVVCGCGYDPTVYSPGSRFEDVWGGVGEDNIRNALGCWNEAVRELPA